MTAEITQMLARLESGDPTAADQLLPLVYTQLRQLAAARLAAEPAGQTLQATALVHEAYLKLVEPHSGPDPSATPDWDGRGHFFAAASQAMRRILVDSARRKKRERHGGGLVRHNASQVEIAAPEVREDLLALDAALDRLAQTEPDGARVVELRYFAGLSLPEAAKILKISPRTADRLWAYSRAWLRAELSPSDNTS